MNKKVFISYSHNDIEQADAVCDKLESANIECWIASRDISPSKDWAEEIIDAINASDVMVLIFSSFSNTSPQVIREIERAVHKGLSILPFRIEDITPSKSLEYYMSTQHWLDAYSGSFDKHLDELYSCVKSLMDGKAATSFRENQAPKHSVSEVSTFNVPSFNESDLNHFSKYLANYLGPVAKFIVDKKASQSTSLKDLVTILSNELDDDRERHNFIQACQPIVSSTSL